MKIQLKNKTKTIFFVSIDNENWGTLPGKVLRFFSVYPGQECIFPDERKQELISEIEKYNWDRLLNFLAYRERSMWECYNFLKLQSLPSNLADKLIIKAKELNFVNDERFAEMYVQDLIAKNKNETQIRSKLIEKHVPEQIITSILSRELSQQNKQEILNANFQKAINRFSSFPAEQRKEKILNFLTRKGFSYWQVKEKMDKEGY
jgi:regulatory protein